MLKQKFANFFLDYEKLLQKYFCSNSYNDNLSIPHKFDDNKSSSNKCVYKNISNICIDCSMKYHVALSEQTWVLKNEILLNLFKMENFVSIEYKEQVHRDL